MNKVFLDTSYAVAVSSRTDENHQRAVELAQELDASGTYLITTRAILLEIGNALAKSRHREAAVKYSARLKMTQRLKSFLLRTNCTDVL